MDTVIGGILLILAFVLAVPAGLLLVYCAWKVFIGILNSILKCNVLI
jgi:hypothetical protein